VRTVGDIMTTDVLTVKQTATLGEVARAMRHRNVGSAIVVGEAGEPVGIISERELVESVARSRNPDQGTAQSWMNADLVLAGPETDTTHALEAMSEHHVRHLTVVREGRLVGVVSMRDLVSEIVRD